MTNKKPLSAQELHDQKVQLVRQLLPAIRRNPAKFRDDFLGIAVSLDPSLLKPRKFVVLSPSNTVLCELTTNSVGARETQVFTGRTVVPFYSQAKAA